MFSHRFFNNLIWRHKEMRKALKKVQDFLSKKLVFFALVIILFWIKTYIAYQQNLL